MENEIKIGMIGLDTSHVPAFTELLNDPGHKYHVPGGKVVAAFPGGSPDFELSYSRVDKYTNHLREHYGVTIVDSPEAVAKQCDAILLESVDGRVHLEQFKRIAPYRKPTFIDKPFAVSTAHAEMILREAERYRVPVMSCSALRYAEGFRRALHDEESGPVIGVDTYGPMELQPTQPGLFWYGIHTVEMLFAALGKGCRHVRTETNDDFDVVVGVWSDGRLGTVRGNRKGNRTFGALLHRKKTTHFVVDVYADEKPYYASLLEHIMTMFKTGEPAIHPEETLEVVRFIEAANESRNSGKTVRL